MKPCKTIVLVAGSLLVLASCAHERASCPPLGQVNPSPRVHQPGYFFPTDLPGVAQTGGELTWDTSPAMW